MISLAEAQARILADLPALTTDQAPLLDAAYRYLAADVTALRNQPARDLSAMDGYAVAGPGPWTVIGESAAGSAFTGTCPGRSAVRIFTGAILPDGADRILIQEHALVDGQQLRAHDDKRPKLGQHVRHRASDFAINSPLLSAGDLLTPARLGLAAAAGHGTLPVARRIKIALLSTGNELVTPGIPCDDQQIPASNALMLSTLLPSAVCTIDDLGIVRDEMNALGAAIAQAADADILVTLGGASVGDHDLVRPALLANEATIDFWKVAMRPGKPVMFGRRGHQLILGLPGNPVSAYVTATLFLLPLVRKMAGARDHLPIPHAARLTAPLPANGERVDHLRAHLGPDGVVPTGHNDSAALRALASANCLIIRPPHAQAAEIGASVAVISTP